MRQKIFCIFNADGSFDPKYLRELKNRVLSGQDLSFVHVMRKKEEEDDTVITYIGNKFFTGFCNLLFKLNLTDVLFTYVMGSTKAFKNLEMKF